MKKNSKTIKFFISSTFKDFLKERNALQTFVFPRLKKLCQSKGFAFQPVDLRWGVTSESSDDNQTMNFCLNEVERCSSEPKPNLLVLLGQRYGWGPLPSRIDNKDFLLDIIDNVVSSDDELFFKTWYQLDENNIPAIRYLKEKKGVTTWDEDEKRLKHILQDAVGDNVKYQDFFKSATELEIRDALNKFEGNEKNTFTYLRSFNDISDEDYYEANEESQTKLEELKDYLRDGKCKLIEKKELDLASYKLSDKDLDKEQFSELSLGLQEFCIAVFKYYYKTILEEIKSFTHHTDLEIELQEQKEFLHKKSKVVLGREDEIKEIKNFISCSDEQYYLLYGKSGSGKSSVMAQTIFDITDTESKDISPTNYKVIYRFIGTTAHTTSPRDTYEHIYWELSKTDNKPILEQEDYKFCEQFRELLASYDKTIIIFIDAVDQFNSYDGLSIFLDELPKNVKVVFSTLNKHQQEDNIDTLYYERLISSISNSYELGMLTNSNDAILKIWLNEAKRTLTPSQEKYLLTQCHNQTALFLRLSFIMAKEWKSSYAEYEKDIQGNEKDLILKFFQNLEKNHYHKENLIKRVLGFISASKDGLSESELIDLLSREEDILKNYEREGSSYPKLSKLPDAIFSRLYFNMQEVFTEKFIDGEMLITPFHRIIEETINEQYYKDEKILLHRKLADYFGLEYMNISLRVFNELPWSLYKLEDFSELKKIILDHKFKILEQNNELAWYAKQAYDKWDASEYIFDEESSALQIEKLQAYNSTDTDMDKRVYLFIVNNFSNDSSINAIHQYIENIDNSNKYITFLIELAMLIKFSIVNNKCFHVVKYITLYIYFEVGESNFSIQLNTAITRMFHPEENFPFGIYNDVKDSSGDNTKMYIAKLTDSFTNTQLNISIFENLFNFHPVVNDCSSSFYNELFTNDISSINEVITQAIIDENLEQLEDIFCNRKEINISAKYLLEAIQYNSFLVAEFLIDENVDIVVEYMHKNHLEDTEPIIPILEAFKNAQYDIVELLLENGAYTEFIDYIPEGSLLYFAVLDNNLEMIELLLRFGADENQKSVEGMTPLNLALEEEKHAIAGVLTQSLTSKVSSIKLKKYSLQEHVLILLKDYGKKDLIKGDTLEIIELEYLIGYFLNQLDFENICVKCSLELTNILEPFQFTDDFDKEIYSDYYDIGLNKIISILSALVEFSIQLEIDTSLLDINKIKFTALFFAFSEEMQNKIMQSTFISFIDFKQFYSEAVSFETKFKIFIPNTYYGVTRGLFSFSVGSRINYESDKIIEIIQERSLNRAIIGAIKNKDYNSIKYILENNLDIVNKYFDFNGKDNTLLVEVISMQEYELVKLIINMGGDINKGYLDEETFLCSYPIAIAVWSKQYEIVNLLLKNNVDIELGCSEVSALLPAILNQDSKMIQLLLKNNPQISEESLDYALDCAIDKEIVSILEFLLDYKIQDKLERILDSKDKYLDVMINHFIRDKEDSEIFSDFINLYRSKRDSTSNYGSYLKIATLLQKYITDKRIFNNFNEVINIINNDKVSTSSIYVNEDEIPF